jgi:hypothetical protein
MFEPPRIVSMDRAMAAVYFAPAPGGCVSRHVRKLMGRGTKVHPVIQAGLAIAVSFIQTLACLYETASTTHPGSSVITVCWLIFFRMASDAKVFRLEPFLRLCIAVTMASSF